jgi:KUP system potassium uptake protein
MGQASSQAAGAEHSAAKPLSMLVAAVGVVYGDIGTSPLYTLKEVFPAVMACRSTTMACWAFWR